MTETDRRREPKLEFPEIQVVPSIKSKDGDSDSKPMGGGFGRRPQMVGDAKKKFSKMALKVITQIVTEEEKAPPPMPPVKKPAEKPVERKQSRVKRASPSPRPGGDSPAPSHGKQSMGSLPDLISASAPQAVGKAQSNQFASLVRLAKFRRMTHAFGKGSSASSRRTSIADIEEEADTPEMPRFCATLSPEAQYSMMKGYEDVLLDRIKKARSEYNNLLYRVKTPHQTVLALHIAEAAGVVEGAETRSQFTVSRPPSSHDGNDRTLSRTLTTLNQERGIPRLPIKRDHTLPKIGGKKFEPTESQVKRITVPKEKQRKLSIKFQRAMDILDALKTEQGVPITATTRTNKVTNPITYYNSWSQAWAREFQFEYSTLRR